jgi:hypothetical protein
MLFLQLLNINKPNSETLSQIRKESQRKRERQFGFVIFVVVGMGPKAWPCEAALPLLHPAPMLLSSSSLSNPLLPPLKENSTCTTLATAKAEVPQLVLGKKCSNSSLECSDGKGKASDTTMPPNSLTL